MPLRKDVDSPAWTRQPAFTVSAKGGKSLRTDEWRFTQRGFGNNGYELYDLKKDPGEFTNQANNPEYAATLKRLREQLEAKRLQAGYQGTVTQKHGKKRKALKPRRAKTDTSK